MTTTTAPCTCHSIQYGATVTYTYAAIGVPCPSCEASQDDRDALDAWLALTPQERTAYRWNAARRRIRAINNTSWDQALPRPGLHPYGELPPF